MSRESNRNSQIQRDRNNHLLAGTDRDNYIHTGTRVTYRSISLQAETVHKSLLANKTRLEYDIKVKTTSLAAIKLQAPGIQYRNRYCRRIIKGKLD